MEIDLSTLGEGYGADALSSPPEDLSVADLSVADLSVEDLSVEDLSNQVLNLTRELTKAQSVLVIVDRALTAEAEVNAAKHLSSEMIVSPLASRVKSVLHGLSYVLPKEIT